MAVDTLTGATEEEVEQMRADFDPDQWDMEFEERYCLAKIPNQPEDYDGPPRFCKSMNTIDRGDAHLCKFHGGAAGSIDDGDRRKNPALAPITHGMNAALENLVRDFDEKDQKLYNWITESYADAYDIDLVADPASQYDLHRLAAEIVRAERGRGYLISEGEVHEKEVRNDEGKIVIGDDGEVVTEKSEHYLAQMMHRQDKKITQLEKELGISRKERLKQDATDSAVESIKNFAEVGQTILQRDENEYSEDDAPWEEDE